MRTSLVIMAAGIGSRFGGGIKQLAPVGPNGEIIMDYSIHDALNAGFDKLIFIIRKDIEQDFIEIIGKRMEALCAKKGVEIAYAYQDLNDLPEGFTLPEGRTKPWGTGQAILAALDVIHEPFAVINADDYYGKVAFQKLYDFLQDYNPSAPNALGMAGFVLENTLSDNGGVTRGLCESKDGFLTKITETFEIEKKNGGVYSDTAEIDPKAVCSMNMWALTPEFVDTLKKGFVDFLSPIEGNPLKAEYLLPTIIGDLLQKNAVTVKVMDTPDKWFGVTYKEDKESVIASFKELIAAGVYQEKLFSDL